MDRTHIPSTLEFSLPRSLEVLERTPRVLHTLLNGLSEDWTHHNEGPDTWTPYDVVGHLLHGERTDWMARLKKCLSTDDKAFVKFDRFAQYQESEGRSLGELLAAFAAARARNLEELKAMDLSDAQLDSIGIHPTFGEVRLRQLLATWAAHDMAHLAQIARVMCRQYRAAVGPWREFMTLMG